MTITDLDRPLVAIKRTDHTDFYVNCPISKTGFCISGIIDMKPSEDYPWCAGCEFNNGKGGCAFARIKAGIPDNAQLVNYKTDNAKRPIFAAFIIKGERYSTRLQPGKDMGESIIDLWDRLQPDVASFVNLRTGRYVRIYKDPKTQFAKYHGRCYGRISSDGYNYSNDSVVLYGVNDDCWACTWYIKNGQSMTGPFGYQFPI